MITHAKIEAPGLAVLHGWQENGTGGGFWLWNLTRTIPGHCIGSTVTTSTLRRFLAVK